MTIKTLRGLPRPLKKLQHDYQLLQKVGFTSSIIRLIDDRRNPLSDYCQPFQPHPASKAIIQAARQFCIDHGIWLDNAQHYITCQLFLYPTASYERMLVMTKNNAIDYYLNDTYGRDLFRSLSEEQQGSAAAVIERMSHLDENTHLIADAQPVERANAKMLAEIRDSSPKAWFSEFLRLYNYHLEVTHRNCNTSALGYIPDIAQYVDMRYHTSGMPHIVLLLEYAEANFLDWGWLNDTGLAPSLQRLHWLIAAFGCLSNDLFSFEKEVIDNGTDANLLAAIALNEPSWQLTEVIYHAATMVKDILREYFDLLTGIRKQVRDLSAAFPAEAAGMTQHLDCVERCVQASWKWQVHTQRYKRVHSIWEETQLPEPAILKAV